MDHTNQIVGLRLAVGFLGEQERWAWWPSKFLGQHAHAFLNPIFGKKTRIAQYHGVTEAARLIHDESIGVGQVFHLFRLPETIEQRLFDVIQEGSVPEHVMRHFDLLDSAESVLADLAKEAVKPKSGPVRLGSPEMVNSPEGLSLVAATYQAAFQASIKCFPYLTDR